MGAHTSDATAASGAQGEATSASRRFLERASAPSRPEQTRQMISGPAYGSAFAFAGCLPYCFANGAVASSEREEAPRCARRRDNAADIERGPAFPPALSHSLSVTEASCLTTLI